MATPAREKPRFEANHAVVALLLLSSIIHLLDFFRVQYFTLISGFVEKVVFSVNIDMEPLLFILSVFSLVLNYNGRRTIDVLIPAVLAVSSYFLVGFSGSVLVLSLSTLALSLRFNTPERLVIRCLVFLSGLEGLALIYWLVRPFMEFQVLGSVVDLEGGLYGVVSLLSPFIVLLLLYSWSLRPIFSKYLDLDLSNLEKSIDVRALFFGVNPRIILLVALAISVLVPLYPYAPGLNRELESTSPDYPLYHEWLDRVDEDPWSAFGLVAGSRPLLFLLMNSVQRTMGLGARAVILFSPVVLNLLLVYSVYFMVSRGFGDEGMGSLSSLFTVLGPSTAVLMFAYNFANVLGLSLLFLSLGALSVALRTGENRPLTYAIILSTLVGYAHPWTLYQFYAGIGFVALFYGSILRRGEGGSRGFQKVLVYLGAVGVFEGTRLVVMNLLFGSSVISTMIPALGGASTFLRDFFPAVVRVYGGLLSNSVLLLVSALGLWWSWRGDFLSRVLSAMIFLSSFVYLFGGLYTMNRLLLNIPLGVLASRFVHDVLANPRISDEGKKVGLVFLVLSSGVYTLRSLFHLI